MPASLEPGEKQLNTEQANDSREVTKTRWIMESRNGHLKSNFKFLANTILITHAIHIGDFYIIADAILNKYRKPMNMAGATVD